MPARPLTVKPGDNARENQITSRAVTRLRRPVSQRIRRVGSLMRRRLLFAERFELTQARCPTFLNDLAAARHRQGVGRHVRRDDRPGPDISALPDSGRRHQRGVGADEGVLADRAAILGTAVVIAGDRAGVDEGVADTAQLLGLGTGFDNRLPDLDEVADARAGAEPGAAAARTVRPNRPRRYARRRDSRKRE